jgi:hypothetical protein
MIDYAIEYKVRNNMSAHLQQTTNKGLNATELNAMFRHYYVFYDRRRTIDDGLNCPASLK